MKTTKINTKLQNIDPIFCLRMSYDDLSFSLENVDKYPTDYLEFLKEQDYFIGSLDSCQTEGMKRVIKSRKRHLHLAMNDSDH